MNNDIKALKSLIVSETDLDKEDGDGDTPAVIAAHKGHLEVLKFLAEKGADLKKANESGATPALIAAGEGHLEILKFLSEKGADLNRADINDNALALRAAKKGHLEMLKFLAEKGADLNIADSSGNAPALFVAGGGHLETLKFLAEKGADLKIVNKSGATLALQAARAGRLEVLKFLAEKGADLNKTSVTGYTPALIAAKQGHLEVLKFLAEKGADLNKADMNGNTPSLLAAEEGHLEVLKFLAEKGADLNKADKDGYNPAYVAAGNGHLEVLKFLTKKGADLNKASTNGETPAYFAVQNGHLEVLKFLAEKGADLNKADMNGHTPTLLATQLGHTAVVKFLKENELTSRYRRLYSVKIENAVNSNELAKLKSNLLEDIKEQQTLDSDSFVSKYLLGLKDTLNKKAQALYLQEKEHAIDSLPRKVKTGHQHAETDQTSCLICAEDLPNLHGTTCGPAGCSCPICPGCAVEYAKSEVRGGGGEKGLMTCPICKDPTKISFLKKLYDSEMPAEELEQLKTRAIAQQIQKFNQLNTNHLPCPGLNCLGGGIASEDSCRHTCIQCDFKGCLKCEKDHLGSKCEGIKEAHHHEMRKFLEEAKKVGAMNRPCPFCGKIVHRIDGCNAVNCPECAKSFHWNYGEFTKFPHYEAHKTTNGEVHDFQADVMHYYDRNYDDSRDELTIRDLDRLHY